MSFDQFPAELKALPQWMVAGSGDPSSRDYKRPIDPKTGKWGSPTDPKTWGTFDQARASGYPLIGFVFHESDPFTVIDLDTYKAQTEAVKAGHSDIIATLETYAETSQSGFGTHIIGRGSVPEGVHNHEAAMEIYSSGRFMICTGRAVGGFVRPIADIQDFLDYYYPMLKNEGTGLNWRDLGDGEESELSDADVIERASNADNGALFDALCAGDLSQHGNDHSAADAALIQFLCFYTPDNQQVRRLFLMSELGQRDKALRPDYIPRTIQRMRGKLDAEAIPPIDMSAIAERARKIAQTPPPAPERAEPVPAQPRIEPLTMFPPGLVGEIAQYVLSASIRPVPEVALATAIATTAGIVGRNYNCSSPATGLNQYILLLARTGTGKESVQSSIDRLFAEVQKTFPAADRFVGPAHFASGQALVKSFQDRPCFMSVVGEFGHRLQAMAHPRANAAEKTLMAALLDVYAKSGWGQMLRPSVYSDKEKNTAMVHAPALTLLGEAEPEGFFSSLDESTVASGFLPRFLVIEYTGDRPARNRHALTKPPADLVTSVANLCGSVLSMEQAGTCLHVQMEPEAAALLDQFDEHADNQIRGAAEMHRQLWNRAHLKALRLASLIAVGVDAFHPVVTTVEARWAIALVERDINVLLSRFDSGDVGEGDGKRMADVMRIIKSYLSKSAKGEDMVHVRGCISRRYLAQRTNTLASFKNHRLGSTAALKIAIEALIADGRIVELPKKQAQEWFQSSAIYYALGDQWDE